MVILGMVKSDFLFPFLLAGLAVGVGGGNAVATSSSPCPTASNERNEDVSKLFYSRKTAIARSIKFWRTAYFSNSPEFFGTINLEKFSFETAPLKAL